MDDSMRLKLKKAFLKDDYERISVKYFKELRESGQVHADPSYWYKMNSVSLKSEPQKFIGKYQSDYRGGLLDFKEKLLPMINAWDTNSYNLNEITICSSVTSASTIVLSTIQRLGVRTVYFETPAYFASIEQCSAFGIEPVLIPTYKQAAFVLDMKSIVESGHPKAIWITQPRFGLGCNQTANDVLAILSTLKDNDYLIIDEATEQFFPSVLREINLQTTPNVIKLRSFFKPMGINGPRIAYIIHKSELKNSIEDQMEVFQGAVDVFSLTYANTFAENPKRFETMLKISNNQVQNLMSQVETFCIGSSLSPNKLVNGYIGSVAVNLTSQNIPHLRRRELLLKHCKKNRVPVILGATMKFARDENFEFVRLNYFNEDTDIMNGLKVLASFSL